MSVLSDADIGKELAYGELDVSPVDLEEQLQPNSLDIRLGEEFSVFCEQETVIDPKEELEEYYDYIDRRVSESIIIQPEEFILGTTIEKFTVPDYLYGQLNGRSSIGRLGIEVHSTAGLIDSGYSEGEITLEIKNNNKRAIKLFPGMRIGQVVFHELSSKCSNPYSSKDNKYQGQEGVVHSRLSEEL
jgi:dCTP deaminase